MVCANCVFVENDVSVGSSTSSSGYGGGMVIWSPESVEIAYHARALSKVSQTVGMMEL
jgi:RNA polymerase subunit RPABC4/transcription elongation factor Spt4